MVRSTGMTTGSILSGVVRAVKMSVWVHSMRSTLSMVWGVANIFGRMVVVGMIAQARSARHARGEKPYLLVGTLVGAVVGLALWSGGVWEVLSVLGAYGGSLGGR